MRSLGTEARGGEPEVKLGRSLALNWLCSCPRAARAFLGAAQHGPGAPGLIPHLPAAGRWGGCTSAPAPPPPAAGLPRPLPAARLPRPAATVTLPLPRSVILLVSSPFFILCFSFFMDSPSLPCVRSREQGRLSGQRAEECGVAGGG